MLVNFIKKIIREFISLIFPSTCPVCKNYQKHINMIVCENCREELKSYRFKSPMISGEESAKDRKVYFDRLWTLFEYRGTIKKLIFEFKFKRRVNLANYFSNEMFQLIVENEKEEGNRPDIITSVPMGSKKLKKRGYNQAKLVAKKIARLYSIPYMETLGEKNLKRNQKELPYNFRFFNVLQRFYIKNKKRIVNKKIIIIDDVYTTGATLNECSRLLKKGGVRSVEALAIASVPEDELESFKLN